MLATTRRAATYSLIIIPILLLCHCTKAVNTSSLGNQSTSSPYSMPATAYLALAKNQSGPEKQTMLLMAAGRYLYDGQWQEAAPILTHIDPMSSMQADEKTILLATLDGLKDDHHQAIDTLGHVEQLKTLPPMYQAGYHETLAKAYEAVGNPTYAITERIKKEPFLINDAERLNNQKALWTTLNRLPVPELATMAAESNEQSELQGWLQLALIPRESASEDESLFEKISAWQSEHPHHPANHLLIPSLSMAKSSLHDAPKQIALLLPFSGPLAGPGNAIRDGFLASNLEASSSRKPTIKSYDTATGDIEKIYEQALAEGAEYIVGPLSKADVAKIAKIPHPVPTLLLNETDVSELNNTYQFSLSPANEAKQVAQKAREQGHRQAIIITPAGPWGEDIVTAFSNEWQQEGGEVIDKLSYDNKTNLSQEIRTLLRVSEKAARDKQTREAFDTKRRQDFDMIFLAAYPSKARQIVPLLKYFFAGNVPVYATSTVYAANANKQLDKDLEGVIFCDMPWLFSHPLVSKNWPEQLNSYSRLYVLGLDSYALATQINQLVLFPDLGINVNSGMLYLNQKQQLVRVPAWGQFKNGTIQTI